ncbi:MAG TPA: site-specific DNA-methyltransferase [Candidatus Kryptonia bacterium]
MDGKSSDVKRQQLDRLKVLFPEVISEGKIDFEKLKLTLGEDITVDNERYVLNWAGKSDAFRAIQTPTTATLKPQRDQSIDFDTTQNIFIEGENLEVLKVLQKSYYGKVKMIYIDPPYNTGNDSFIYPDKFSESKDEYLKRIGDKDEAGYLTKEGFFRKNSKENGQYHSNWLSMMYPRLFLARNLLREDGVIFVSIDDNEVHNLRLMMNEIFGEESLIASFVWHRRQMADSRNQDRASTDHEYVLCYKKETGVLRGRDIDTGKFSNPDNDPRGPWFSADLTGLATKDKRPNLHYDVVNPRTGIVHHPSTTRGWSVSQEKFQKYIEEDRILWPAKPDGRPRFKKFFNEVTEFQTGFSTMLKVGFTTDGTREIQEIFGGKIMPFPKPVELVKTLIQQAASGADIVLDFFAGSGTTAQAVMELNKEDSGNRKFILVQLPEKTDEDSEAYKAGYKTIADICKERIRRAGQKIKGEKAKEEGLFKGKEVDTGFKAFTLEPSNFKVWRTDTMDNGDDLVKQMDAFADPTRAGSEADAMAWEILVKSGYELTTKLEKLTVGGVPIYSIAEGEVALALEKISRDAIVEIGKMKPKNFICLDRLFAGNDQLKTNTALQMKDAGVEFRTI